MNQVSEQNKKDEGRKETVRQRLEEDKRLRITITCCNLHIYLCCPICQGATLINISSSRYITYFNEGGEL